MCRGTAPLGFPDGNGIHHRKRGADMLFFYNKDTRTAASGILLEDKFTNLQDFGPAAGFSEWTHIVGTSR